ncbi:MAG: hypothetical protein ACLFQ5_05460 [Oceanicaulis sp.]
MSTTHPAKPAVDALLADHLKAWKANDAARLKPLWGASQEPLYLAEEIEETLADWLAVERYWAMNEGRHADVQLVISDGVIRDLADGLVIAAYRMDWRIAFKHKSAMAGDNRVAAVVRLTEYGWRFAAWIEAPLAAITYVRSLYTARAGA